MFIEKRGDEMKLMKCIGQSALYLVVEDGKAYPIPRAGAMMHRILPGIPVGGDVRDGTYTVDDTKALRSLLSEAGDYGRLRVFPGTARRRMEFRPEGLFPDGMSCKMDAEYLESVPLVLGRKGLRAYADTDNPGAWIHWDGMNYYTRPVWFRSEDGSVDMLIMPMRPY